MFSLLLAATPSPSPTGDASSYYSPGTLGFIFTFFMAGAAILIIFDMVRRMRRVRYREEIREKLAAEATAGRSKRNK
jgi:hypothetical protein